MLSNYKILNLINRFILPFIVFLAIYVQISGEDSPGGGFQAGAIFASSMIAMTFISDFKICNQKSLIFVAASGVMIYFITGIIPMFSGYMYLDYRAFAASNIVAQKIGIFVIELGVGLTVFSSILLIYLLFSEE
ncbi:MAG: hypothetical protein KA998_00760 [Rickettsiaceae bacterium]|nr:hypothetical protein [Rickettsiaceae bacterium]